MKWDIKENVSESSRQSPTTLCLSTVRGEHTLLENNAQVLKGRRK